METVAGKWLGFDGWYVLQAEEGGSLLIFPGFGASGFGFPGVSFPFRP